MVSTFYYQVLHHDTSMCRDGISLRFAKIKVRICKLEHITEMMKRKHEQVIK